ncbi:Lrp/AsnC family transcriptional regulator [Arthrobacter caoxuetaonis]|uniref:Lrp/AsnC family transcriptional regulator n=1 Tax=Arthrobacter caoxuetaonis TaxID=2886935 RepID=UPI001D141A7F|nr:Lrp/AsnC family transcriptional regulator [Arthrobacter caoxuetaonis]
MQVNAPKIDEVDRRIISLLQQDGRRSFTSIGRELGLSEGAVRYRTQNLTASGLIQIVAVSDPLELGYEILTMVDVETRPGAEEAVASELAELAECIWVALLGNGPAHVRVEVLCGSPESYARLLFDVIGRIDGVVRTQAVPVLDIVKSNFGWDLLEAPES